MNKISLPPYQLYINRQHKCMRESEDVAEGDNFDKSDENIIAMEQNK